MRIAKQSCTSDTRQTIFTFNVSFVSQNFFCFKVIQTFNPNFGSIFNIVRIAMQSCSSDTRKKNNFRFQRELSFETFFFFVSNFQSELRFPIDDVLFLDVFIVRGRCQRPADTRCEFADIRRSPTPERFPREWRERARRWRERGAFPPLPGSGAWRRSRAARENARERQ